MKTSIAIWSLALGLFGLLAGANAQETRDTKKADNNQNNAQRDNAQGNQNNAQRNQNPQAGQAGQAGARQGQAQGQSGQAGRMDEFVASCLILENQNEVAAAKLAQQHAKSSEVKSFAQQMEKDHSQMISELAKFAREDFKNRRLEGRGSESAGAGNADRGDQAGAAARTTGKNEAARGGEARPAAGAPGAPATGATAAAGQAGQAQGQGGDVLQTQLQIKHEIADQCLSSASKELSSKKGEEFDECYIGSQIVLHMKMIDELKVLERHVSSQLASTLKDGRQHAEHHLDQAKKIKDSLAGHSGSNKNRDSKSSDK